MCGNDSVSEAKFISICAELWDEGGEKKRRDFSALSVLCDNECFVRENPSMVTVGGGNVRESYGLLAFNSRGQAQQSN